MDILSIVVIAFIVLESLNIMMLYFAPESSRGNGVGVFSAFEKSKEDPEVHALVRYLINWVAGTKLIFILLLIGILIAGDSTTRVLSVVALILSIATFFYRLYPAIKSMDKNGQITPKGYSRTLGIIIAVFLLVFTAALVVYLVGNGPICVDFE